MGGHDPFDLFSAERSKNVAMVTDFCSESAKLGILPPLVSALAFHSGWEYRNMHATRSHRRRLCLVKNSRTGWLTLGFATPLVALFCRVRRRCGARILSIRYDL